MAKYVDAFPLGRIFYGFPELRGLCGRLPAGSHFLDFLNFVATDALMYLRAPDPSGDRGGYAPHGYRGLMAGSVPGLAETQYIRCCPFSLSARCKPGLASYHHVLFQGVF